MLTSSIKPVIVENDLYELLENRVFGGPADPETGEFPVETMRLAEKDANYRFIVGQIICDGRFKIIDVADDFEFGNADRFLDLVTGKSITYYYGHPKLLGFYYDPLPYDGSLGRSASGL